uniref:Uncharacterized protein n=1 Tax=Helianthus annuus TaxID=4232 RepID=A0A251VQX1_HELAN
MSFISQLFKQSLRWFCLFRVNYLTVISLFKKIWISKLASCVQGGIWYKGVFSINMSKS